LKFPNLIIFKEAQAVSRLLVVTQDENIFIIWAGKRHFVVSASIFTIFLFFYTNTLAGSVSNFFGFIQAYGQYTQQLVSATVVFQT